MRRGLPRGGGGGNKGRMSGQYGSAPSPFISDIQGLKDIDMELELLKRKREIIEKQQMMLSTSFNRQRDDFESSYNSQDYDYDDRSYDDSSFGSSGSRKRSIQVWEHEPPPKRFAASGGGGSGPSRSVPRPNRGGSGSNRGGSGSYRGSSAAGRGANKSFGSRSGPPPNQRSSNFDQGQKPFRRPNPPPKRKDFNPSKASKPGAIPSLMSLERRAPPERRTVAPRAGESRGAAPRGGPAPRGVPASDDEWVLRCDRAPSRQLTGRLELALGNIMKELKLAHAEYDELFVSPATQRAMKQVVRERIKTAMIGKKVGYPDQIIAVYKELHAGKDSDIIMKAIEARTAHSPFVPIPSDKPEVYFKKNMDRLMTLKMEQMFKKLEDIYNPNYKPQEKKRWRGRSYGGKDTKANQANAESDPANNKEQPETDFTQDTDVEIKTDTKTDEKVPTGNIEKENQESETTDSTAEKTNNESEITIEPLESGTTDPEESVTDPKESESNPEETETTDPKESETTDPNESETTDLKESGTTEPMETETTEPMETETTEPKKSGTTNDLKKSKTTDNANEVKLYEDDIISTEQYIAYDRFLSMKMTHLLKKCAPRILKLLEVDGMYRKVEASIREETKKMLMKNIKPAPQATVAPVKTEEESPQRPPHHLPYFVKLMGKPNLPKRKAMDAFFEQFKPKIIKKHRTVHNLLFVGFAEKESFEAILAASGTVIGRFTLDIIVSERNFTKPPKVEISADVKNENNTSIENSDATSENTEPSVKEKLEDSSDRLISSDLDEQISDLLTSIRKSEDNTSNNGSIEKENDVAESEIPDKSAVAQEENKDLSPAIIEDMLTEIKGDNATEEELLAEVKDGMTAKVIMNDDLDVSIGDGTKNEEENKEVEEEEKEVEETEIKDSVGKLKKAEPKPATPTRSSARLTRRTSTVQ